MKKTLLLLFLLTGLSASAQNDLLVLKDKWLSFTDAPNSLYHYLADQAFILLKEREGKLAGFKDLSDWQKWQAQVRETLFDITGPFPDKTPLNPQIVRVIDKGSFRVEHIVFESIPHFYVTSSLYLPVNPGRKHKFPAVIYCSGHSADGYRSDVYQHVILNLVKKGFAVFAFDPVGQGERLEYFDVRTGKSIIGGPTSEHSYPGAQAFLTGSSQARYMIWDGIRAVDYLLSRKEIDPTRIGITGRSGGGTQSAYIAAFDDRIYAAAPENYLTNYTRLLQTIGPQDAEQNLFNLINRGLDHPDFLIVRAPRPALMITTTGDMFSIQGAMETETEVSRIYRLYGAGGNFSRVEDDAAHASTKRNREAMYAFFQKHLNNPGSPLDEDIKGLTKEELQVTRTGQVSTSFGGESVFSLNLYDAVKLSDSLDKRRSNPDLFYPRVLSDAKRLSGYREFKDVEKPVFAGRILRDGYTVEKYLLKGEGNYVIPYLLFKPSQPHNKTIIYLNPSGKSAEASPGGEIEKLVKLGIAVLAPDLPGMGELGPGNLKGDAYFNGVSHNLWYASMLIGRSITGIQSGDMNRLVTTVRTSDSHMEIIGFARKGMTSVVLHAAAFNRDISRVIIVEPCLSWRSIADNRFYDPALIMNSVPGALKEYDLPDLAASLAPRDLVIVNPVNQEGKEANGSDLEKDIDYIKESYHRKSRDKNFVLLKTLPLELSELF
jgi:hypothetical protein